MSDDTRRAVHVRKYHAAATMPDGISDGAPEASSAPQIRGFA